MHPAMYSYHALLLIVGPALSATIPMNIKGCKWNDPNVSECAIKAINFIKPTLIDGIEEFAVPVLDPFQIKNVVLSEKNNRGLDLALNFNDVKIKGIRDVVIEPTSTLDLEKRTLRFQASIPTLTLDAKYEVDGRILLLPIKGEGDGNLTLGDLKVTFDMDFSLHTAKDGKEYFQLVNSKVEYTAGHFNIYLDNLFNGDKTLGNHMNTFLNENWQEVLKEFGPVLRETIKTIIHSVINNVALRVPADVLFPK